MRKALYPGSFNPFTRGHLDIVARALRVFDHVEVCIGVNINKAGSAETAGLTRRYLSEIFDGYPVSVTVSSGLTARAVADGGACCIVRGVRGVTDFEYERTLAETNLSIFGVDTLLLCARPELSIVSSSMVRELEHFGVDVNGWLVTADDVREILGAGMEKRKD
ncbi:MAG: pantetheine-phosphate adenylyltransferase [Muribaculaceae bacterium]|nr:pantetheine-phosphate adenylyltransferase [Muribaculaceae bacterium]